MEEGETVTYTPPPPPLHQELGEGGGRRKAGLVYEATQVKIRHRGHLLRGNCHVLEMTRAVGVRQTSASRGESLETFEEVTELETPWREGQRG